MMKFGIHFFVEPSFEGQSRGYPPKNQKSLVPDRKSREYNFIGQPLLQFQLKLTSEDILTKLLI